MVSESELAVLGVGVEDLGGGFDRPVVRQDLRELDHQVVPDGDARKHHRDEPTPTEEPA